MTKNEILTEAMALEPIDREALAEQLLLRIADDDQPAIDAAWLGEVRLREEAFRSGQMATSPVDEVIARVQFRARR